MEFFLVPFLVCAGIGLGIAVVLVAMSIAMSFAERLLDK
jgi:ABC-type lipoprotein release transport system permease subunit